MHQQMQVPVSPGSALVVLSGGQDSTTCLFWARQHFTGPLHAVTVNYGQRHARELEAARVVAQLAGAQHEVIEVPAVLRGRSPLTDPTQPLERYPDYQQMGEIIGDRVELTFVPARNPFFLCIAANRAVVHNAPHVVTGICQQDNANYPDCTAVFATLMEDALQEALGETGQPDAPYGSKFTLYAPLLGLSKAASIAYTVTILGAEAYAALAYTHTAYDGSYPPVGSDHASLLRAQGFLEANWPDPLVLRAVAEGVMPLPTTTNYTGWTIRRALDLLGSAGPTFWRGVDSDVLERYVR